MKITSPAFGHGEKIPVDYTCEGLDINPPLNIDDIPSGAKNLALIVDDPDAPGQTWTHWTVYNIPVTEKIKEDSVPGTQGMNDFRKTRYGGPCPPPGSGNHRYFFKVYALDNEPNIEEGKTRDELLTQIEGHIIDEAELMGKYGRK